MDQISVGPEPDDLTGSSRSEPELSAGELQVPGRRDNPVELHRSTGEGDLGARTRFQLGYLVGVTDWFVRSALMRFCSTVSVCRAHGAADRADFVAWLRCRSELKDGPTAPAAPADWLTADRAERRPES